MAEPVTLVAAVRDEAPSIEALLRSITGQTRAPDEVVLVDDGSGDGTADEIDRVSAKLDLELTVIRLPPLGLSQARNRGIDAASGTIIAITDGGLVLHPEWLENLVRPLQGDSQLALSAGWFRSVGRTWFERCLGTIITPQLEDVDTSALPFGRSLAFRKEWWARAGGYPDWLPRAGEDHLLNREMAVRGGRFAFAPDAIVLWTPPESLIAFARKYFIYARGDGHAGLYPKRHAIRYAAYAIGAVLALRARGRPRALAWLAAGFALYVSKFHRRLRRDPPGEGALSRIGALGALPVIVVAGDVAKMVGYAVGVIEAPRFRPPGWSPPPP